MLHELDRLGHGPGASQTIFRLEGVLLDYFSRTQAVVHIRTGHLKSSGHTETSFDGGTWTGTALYARYPGIFELARGNSPSGAHATPPGSHYFFWVFDNSPHDFEDAVESFLRGDG